METENCHGNTCSYFCWWLIWTVYRFEGPVLQDTSAAIKPVTPMTAASSQVLASHCAQRKLWVLSSLISRGTGYVCHFSQPRRKCQSCCVICVPGRWHTWLVLINGGSERYQPERGTEESSQASAQLPTNTTERIFPCRYCGCLKSYCVLHYW